MSGVDKLRACLLTALFPSAVSRQKTFLATTDRNFTYYNPKLLYWGLGRLSVRSLPKHSVGRWAYL